MADETDGKDADKRIILFADPMCSWCWGFSPVMAEIADAYGTLVPISLILGGLRPGTEEAMDPTDKEFVRHHWEEVHAATGQPFSFDFFERDGFVYDTEPACRAAVTVRGLAREHCFDYMDALHRAFYVDNRDVTDGEVLAQAAAPFGVEADAFLAAFASEEARQATLIDFHFSREIGVTGYPTVALRDGDGFRALTVGYQPMEALRGPLEAWLAA